MAAHQTTTVPKPPEDPPKLRGVQTVGRLLSRIADGVCGVLFATVFVVFCFKVARRYLAGDAVAWADELCVILFIWIVFLGNSFIVEEHQHITFDLVFRWLSPQMRRHVEIVRSVLVGGIFLAALWGAFDYIFFLWRERTPVMGWRLDYVYLCFGLFMAATIIRLGVRLVSIAYSRQH